MFVENNPTVLCTYTKSCRILKKKINSCHPDPLISATTRHFYALKIYGAILPQYKQILCCYSSSSNIEQFFQEIP